MFLSIMTMVVVPGASLLWTAMVSGKDDNDVALSSATNVSFCGISCSSKKNVTLANDTVLLLVGRELLLIGNGGGDSVVWLSSMVPLAVDIKSGNGKVFSSLSTADALKIVIKVPVELLLKT